MGLPISTDKKGADITASRFEHAPIGNTVLMRIALVSVLAAVALVAVPAGAGSGAASSDAPTLRVGNGEFLVLVGSGFAPRSLVRVRVTGPGVDRRTSVRASIGGRFVTRFTGIERCSVKEATASAFGGARARVPRPWFLRECPPPPPLAPSVGPAA